MAVDVIVLELSDITRTRWST